MKYGLYLCCLVILGGCIDHGDGRWKDKEKENLKRDIQLFENMADKIEDEIEVYYSEYPDERHETNDLDKIIHVNTKLNLDTEILKLNKALRTEEKITEKKNITDNVNQINGNEEALSHKDKVLLDANFKRKKSTIWPTFEDIMLANGKRYDWKNDRWIKVKRKNIYINKDSLNLNNMKDYHIHHKFYYRIVKLNRSKNRRNVVVAVSAVR